MAPDGIEGEGLTGMCVLELVRQALGSEEGSEPLLLEGRRRPPLPRLSSEMIDVLNNLGNSLRGEGRLREAAGCYILVCYEVRLYIYI